MTHSNAMAAAAMAAAAAAAPSGAGAGAANTFPILKINEIVACLKELDLAVTPEDIQNPQPAIARAVYEHLAKALMGVTREELRQPKFGALDQLQFPQLHEDSIPEFGLQRSILKLLAAAGVREASLRNVLAPTRKDMVRNLSALINFAKFREEQLVRFTEMQASSEQLLVQREQLEQQAAQLSATLADLRAQREAEAPRIATLQSETGKLDEQIQELNKQHALLVEQITALKQHISELSDKSAGDKFMILNAKQENDRLRTQIVRSPEKLKRSLSDMGTAQERLKRDIRDSQGKAASLASRFEALGRLEEKVQKRIVNLDEALADHKKSKALLKEIRDAQAQLQQDEENIAELVGSEQHLKKQISAGQDKLFRLQRQFEEKRHEAQMTLDQLQNDRMLLQRSQAKDKARVEQLEALIAQKRQELETMRRQHEEDLAALRTRFQQVTDAARGYHERLADALKRPVRA